LFQVEEVWALQCAKPTPILEAQILNVRDLLDEDILKFIKYVKVEDNSVELTMFSSPPAYPAPLLVLSASVRIFVRSPAHKGLKRPRQTERKSTRTN
jgi:hypothetical protein